MSSETRFDDNPQQSASGEAERPALPNLGAATGAATHQSGGATTHSIDLLKEVPLRVSVELGRTRLLVRDVLALRPGSVVVLDRQAGSDVDILVNGTLLARGEVVVVDEHFGVRITEVVTSVPIAS